MDRLCRMGLWAVMALVLVGVARAEEENIWAKVEKAAKDSGSNMGVEHELKKLSPEQLLICGRQFCASYKKEEDKTGVLEITANAILYYYSEKAGYDKTAQAVGDVVATSNDPNWVWGCIWWIRANDHYKNIPDAGRGAIGRGIAKCLDDPRRSDAVVRVVAEEATCDLWRMIPPEEKRLISASLKKLVAKAQTDEMSIRLEAAFRRTLASVHLKLPATDAFRVAKTLVASADAVVKGVGDSVVKDIGGQLEKSFGRTVVLFRVELPASDALRVAKTLVASDYAVARDVGGQLLVELAESDEADAARGLLAQRFEMETDPVAKVNMAASSIAENSDPKRAADMLAKAVAVKDKDFQDRFRRIMVQRIRWLPKESDATWTYITRWFEGETQARARISIFLDAFGLDGSQRRIAPLLATVPASKDVEFQKLFRQKMVQHISHLPNDCDGTWACINKWFQDETDAAPRVQIVVDAIQLNKGQKEALALFAKARGIKDDAFQNALLKASARCVAQFAATETDTNWWNYFVEYFDKGDEDAQIGMMVAFDRSDKDGKKTAILLDKARKIRVDSSRFRGTILWLKQSRDERTRKSQVPEKKDGKPPEPGGDGKK